MGIVIPFIGELFKRDPNKPRKRETFGKHRLDFEHRCAFRYQIQAIGEGTKHGAGEVVRVKMESGKTALYTLYSQRYSYTFEDTGHRNWRYLFMRYED